MTTREFSSISNTSTTAEFRTMFKELSDEMKLCGLVQTANTGQINWATVNAPAVNTVAGYEIFRFDDALQATAPVFIKLEYGYGPSNVYPLIWMTVSSSTNGAGTMTGTTSLRIQCTNNRLNGYMYAIQNLVYPTKICVKPGYLMVAFKIGGSYTNDGRCYPIIVGFFMVARTVDQTNGANNGDGVSIYHQYGDSLTSLGYVSNYLNFASGKMVPATGYSESHHQVLWDVTSSLVETNKVQFYRHQVSLPKTSYNLYIATYLKSEILTNVLVDATLVGSTPHQYLTMGDAGMCTGSNRNGAHSVVVLYE